MEPTHVAYSIHEDHHPHLKVQRRCRELIAEAKKFNIENYEHCSIRICSQNIEELERLKKKVKKIAKKHASRKDHAAKLFQLCCLDLSGNQGSIRDECKRTRLKIEQLITNNTVAAQFRCQKIVSDPSCASNADEILTAFMWGVQSPGRHIHFRDKLRTLYHKISQNARHGHYSLDNLRIAVRAAGSVIPDYQLTTRVETDKAQYIFHDVLLLHQLGRVRLDHPMRLPFVIQLNVPSKMVDNLHQFIEEGRSPAFKGFREKGAIQFLQACIDLKASPELVNEGLFCLDETSSNFHLKIYSEFMKVYCTGERDNKMLESLVVMNEARPVRLLDLAHSGLPPTIEVLEALSRHFCELRLLDCIPYSTAGKEHWERLFDLPYLKKIVFHLSDQDDAYLAGLLAALDDHSSLPKVSVKNGLGAGRELLGRLTRRNEPPHARLPPSGDPVFERSGPP